LIVAAFALGLASAPLLVTASFARGPESVADIAEGLQDAVVNVSTTQTLKGSADAAPNGPGPKGSPFEEFFDDFFDEEGKDGMPRKVSSLGSGFVIDPSGLVVTNNHVIEGADEIIINFNDGSKLKVDKVLGKDSKTDLALLKVTPRKSLAAVKFGNSTNLKVGDWVMAIGNPFGLGGSVTVGIISAKQRDIQSGPYDDYLQTDAAINKGNSGGPLFNMEGEVIGVNTAIISPTGGSIGIGFAVPSDSAIAVLDQLKAFGETRRGWLGVKIQSITEDIAETLGVKENGGALVSSVTPDSPAAKGGIEAGDVILKFDGKDISGMRGLPRVVAQTPIGKSVDVEILRKGQKKSVKVAVGRLTEEEGAGAEAKQEQSRAPDKALIGLKLAPLTDELREKYNIDKKVKGVVITEVDRASPAAQKGIKAGDVIVEAAQDQVVTVDDVAKSIEKVRKSGRKAVLLRVEDAAGDLRFVALPIE
jgi:serine protease Do